ncbi:MAG: hypothetical protein FJ311_11110 [Rhodospirillales bacterium]|nr:hypothetical protein [Rhodospirillales bacterium]
MPPKNNPLKLNALQLRTLALLQELARHPATATRDPASGEATINHLPHVHGDHVHIGELVVSARDASGFSNPSVWAALERKGLVRGDFPHASVTLTVLGLGYETGLGRIRAGQSDH